MSVGPETQLRALLSVVEPGAVINADLARNRFAVALAPSPWLALADFRHGALAARRRDPLIDRVPQTGRLRSMGDLA